MAALDLCSRLSAPALASCSYPSELPLIPRQHFRLSDSRRVLGLKATNVAPRLKLQDRRLVGATADFTSEPIDVVAEVKTERVLVLGGSGFVGSAICKVAVEQGVDVVSFSRSGKPLYSDPWVDQVLWVSGNVFYADWDALLKGATAVISTIGGFGTNEEMERLNGEANILAVEAASKAGIPKFVYISVHDYNLPSFFLTSGYFTGKRKAESKVLSKYPSAGTILRPGFIYGKRRVNGVDIPLDLIGQPLDKFLSAAESFIGPLKSIPGSDVLLSSPVSVEDVARAAVKSVLDSSIFGVLTIEQIKETARTLKSPVAV